MNRILFLSDLDHNLFQSHRVDDSGVVPMTFNREGAAHCYATRAQATLFDLMRDNAFCVAVTARTPEQMMRVGGWNLKQQHQLALTNLGMTLLYRDGNDAAWEPIEAWSNPYLELADSLSVSVQVDFAQLVEIMDKVATDLLGEKAETQKPRVSLNMTFEDSKLPFYFLVQSKHVDVAHLRDQFEQFLGNSMGQYLYHESEGTFAFWPSYVSKAIATQRLLQALEHGLDDDRFELARQEKGAVDLMMSSGDSMTDLPFMTQAHFWMAPSKSQITEKLVSPLSSGFTPRTF